jgi:hypothetical protein
MPAARRQRWKRRRQTSALIVLLGGVVVGLDLGLEVLDLGCVGFGGLDRRQLVKQVENLEDRSPALLVVPVHGATVCRNHARVGWQEGWQTRLSALTLRPTSHGWSGSRNWRAHQSGLPNRSEAIRRLVTEALEAYDAKKKKMFAEEPTMIKKAAALLVILATLGIASEVSARPTCTIQGTFDGSYHWWKDRYKIPGSWSQ